MIATVVLVSTEVQTQADVRARSCSGAPLAAASLLECVITNLKMQLKYYARNNYETDTDL